MKNSNSLKSLTKEKERPKQTKRSSAVIRELAWKYEFPKKIEGTIFDVVEKYQDSRDREVMALFACWIYDGSRRSLARIQKLEEVFQKHPSRYLIRQEYLDIVFMDNQNKILAGYYTYKDLLILCMRLYDNIKHYGNIQMAITHSPGIRYYDKTIAMLAGVKGFESWSILALGRVNLFLMMMVHCYGYYPFNPSFLLPPMFKNDFFTARVLHLTDSEDETKENIKYIAESLKGFSEQNPLTYHMAVINYGRENITKMMKGVLRKHRMKKP